MDVRSTLTPEVLGFLDGRYLIYSMYMYMYCPYYPSTLKNRGNVSNHYADLYDFVVFYG